MKLVLSPKDLEKIAELISAENNESGYVSLPIEDQETSLIVEYSIESEYTHDCSYDGNGEVTCEYVDVTIEDVYVDGWEIEVEYDSNKLKELTENELKY